MSRACVHLLNGSTAVRTRRSADCALLPCGCAHDGRYWLQLCERHFAEWRELHEKARASRKEGADLSDEAQAGVTTHDKGTYQ